MTTYSLERFNSQFGGFVRNANSFSRIINIECRLLMKKKSSYSKLLAETNTVSERKNKFNCVFCWIFHVSQNVKLNRSTTMFNWNMFIEIQWYDISNCVSLTVKRIIYLACLHNELTIYHTVMIWWCFTVIQL